MTLGIIKTTSGEIEDSKPYPHEIHVTVAAPDKALRFTNACNELGLRPCIFENWFADGQMSIDYLTASDHNVTTAEAREILAEQSAELSRRHFTVVREKIETSPSNKLSPRHGRDDKTPSNGTYYETHFDIRIRDHTLEDRQNLIAYMGSTEAVYLSVNRAKYNEFLATFRLYGVYLEDFTDKLIDVTSKLADRYKIEVADTEFALYDSNVEHDERWVMSYHKLAGHPSR